MGPPPPGQRLLPTPEPIAQPGPVAFDRMDFAPLIAVGAADIVLRNQVFVGDSERLSKAPAAQVLGHGFPSFSWGVVVSS